MTNEQIETMRKKVEKADFELLEWLPQNEYLTVLVAKRKEPKGFHDFVCWTYNFSSEQVLLGMGFYCDSQFRARGEMARRLGILCD